MKRSERPIPPWVKHGRIGTYSNWGCRGEDCDNACKEANRIHVAKWRARKKAEAEAQTDD